MSVYIKGMEMPKSCFQCEFRTKIDPENLLCLVSQKTFEERFCHMDIRDESCPLVPVPDHGRLIDADALMENAQYKGTHDILTAWDVVAAPTIIPADKEGDG